MEGHKKQHVASLVFNDEPFMVAITPAQDLEAPSFGSGVGPLDTERETSSLAITNQNQWSQMLSGGMAAFERYISPGWIKRQETGR